MSNLNDIFQTLEPITLEEMDSVKLMNRTDTKFAFSGDLLPDILQECAPHYRILEVNGVRASGYKTLYFDTDQFDLYTDHHQGRPYRYKVRIRNYMESGLFYLEAKLKVKGRTVKSRIKLSGFEEVFSEKSNSFLQKTLGIQIDLKPRLWNSFHRITLVNKTDKERLTIDFGLSFESEGKIGDVGNLIIAEVKQENRNRNTKIIEILRKYGIRESGMSKYCLGVVLTHPEVKYNNFKQKILLVNKINKKAA